MPTLTKRVADRAAYEGTNNARCVIWDDKLKGFGLRVFPSGQKSFIVSYRTPAAATKRLMTIGRYGALTVEEARKQARIALGAVAKGDDPLNAKAKRTAKTTVADLARVYLEREGRQKKTATEIERRINKWIIPKLGRKQVSEVTTAQVADLHYAIGATAPIEANRVRTILHRLFECARKWGFGVERNHMNPVADVDRHNETSRVRTASDHELPHLWQAIQADEDEHVRAALSLILFTGCRKNEVLRLRWRDVDFGRNELLLADTKRGTPDRVPLSEEAVAVLRRLPRGLGNAAVFPHLNIKRAWARIRARFWLSMHPEHYKELRTRAEAEVAGRSKHAIKDPQAVELRVLQLVKIPGPDRLTIHDLRRTVGSSMALETAPFVIGKALRNPSAVDVYARVQDNDARRALEQHSARLAKLVSC